MSPALAVGGPGFQQPGYKLLTMLGPSSCYAGHSGRKRIPLSYMSLLGFPSKWAETR